MSDGETNRGWPSAACGAWKPGSVSGTGEPLPISFRMGSTEQDFCDSVKTRGGEVEKFGNEYNRDSLEDSARGGERLPKDDW